MEIGQQYRKAQRKGQGRLLFSPFRGLVSPSTNRNKTGGKRIRYRFWSINAHAEQEIQKFLEPTRKPKVTYTENSIEIIGTTCEDLSLDHCTSTPHGAETNGIAERAVRRIREGISAVLLQSGLHEKWSADSMECYCYLRNIQDPLSDGKTPYERLFAKPFLRTNNSFWFNCRISPHFCQRLFETPPIRLESLTWNILRLRLVCGENLERRHNSRIH